MQNLGGQTVEHLESCLLSPAEAQLEEVNLEWPERGDEHVEAHVELLSTNQQGIVDVSEKTIEQPQLQPKFNKFYGHHQNYLEMT